MENIVSDNEKIKRLIQYYKNKGLLIVGLNDSQGVNITTTFFKKGLLEYLASALTSEELSPKVINAFSLALNKTEHIDYFLKNNLSVEEIKLSQIYSAIVAFENVMNDIGLPEFLGKIGNVYRLVYSPKPGDDKIHVSTALKETEEPVMIYSSGVNNLMREVWSNPFGIKKAYKTRDKNPSYYYTLEKAKNPNTIKNVMDAMEKNYNTILGINPNTDIYTLGAYIPKSLQSEEMKVFSDLVLAYNENLIDLCNQYDITFVDTGEVGKKYNNSENNFHISTAGHNALANYILGYMYYKKFESTVADTRQNIVPIEITNEGSKGVLKSILSDRAESYKKATELQGYPKEVQIQIAEEYKRNEKVLQKVLINKSK